MGISRNQRLRLLVARISCIATIFSLWSGMIHDTIIVYAQETVSEPTALYSMAAVLLDGNTGRVLYEKDGNVTMAMASTTKIMTCILALELGDMDDLVVVSDYARSMPEVHLGMISGEEYRLGDLLYSLMLESHNDTAVAIAEHIGGSVEGFAELMNEKARELGCEHTYYITPNGLDADIEVTLDTGESITQSHETTAIELATIMKYCAKESEQSEEFLAITQTDSYTFTANGRTFSCTNHNTYLTMDDTAISGKTGFTNEAGYCYVGIVEDGEECYVVALLACGWPNNKTYKWSDMEQLVTYGYEAYQDTTLQVEELVAPAVQPVEIVNGQTDKLQDSIVLEAVLSQGEFPLTWAMKEEEQFRVEVVQEEVLEAPIEPGTIIGSATYYIEDTMIGTLDLVIEENVEAIDYKWCILEIIKRGLV
ncbi:MAG: D-alanyl-D-alanine carboxypeptidase family protein [Eubacteriales bacterium]